MFHNRPANKNPGLTKQAQGKMPNSIETNREQNPGLAKQAQGKMPNSIETNRE